MAEQGFAILPEFLDGGVVTSLLDDIRSGGVAVSRSGGIRNLASRVPGIADLAASAPAYSLAESLLGARPRLVRSILFDKVPNTNWAIRWHQDKTIAVQERIEVDGFGPWSTKAGVSSVQPPASVLERMVSIRIHLDDCVLENGALQVIPGSHVKGKLAGEEAESWVNGHDAVVCDVPAGGALVMKPLLLHASSPSQSSGHRRVVHLDYAVGELGGGLAWSGNA